MQQLLADMPDSLNHVNLINCRWNKLELIEMVNLLHSTKPKWGKGCEVVSPFLAQYMGRGFKYPVELLRHELQEAIRYIKDVTNVPSSGWKMNGAEWGWYADSPRLGYSYYRDRQGSINIWTVCATFPNQLLQNQFLTWAYSNHKIAAGGARIGKPRLADSIYYPEEVKLWFKDPKQALSLVTLLTSKQQKEQDMATIKYSVPLSQQKTATVHPPSFVSSEGQEILECDYANDLIALADGNISSDEFLSILQEDGLSYDFGTRRFIVL